MKLKNTIILLCTVCLSAFFSTVFSQEIVISGVVIDQETLSPLAGVNIIVKDKLIGTVSEADGQFLLKTKTPAPFTLVFSLIGYATKEIEIHNQSKGLTVLLLEQPILGQEVVISASRVEESIMKSSVTVERMNSREIQNIPAANFFDGLYTIKGVDMNVHSLTFRFPNARGFTGDNNYRMSQLVDGIDNTAPGLSFPAGNIFGLSPIEIESAELLVGASSALYGPGGMNGILLMKSKDPFQYQGLDASLQTGLMHLGSKYLNDPTPMVDFNLRYAKAFKNRFAFRIGASYLSATDWYAADYRDKNHLNNPAITRESYPGYDGVNVYGDDIIAPVNLIQLAPTIAAGIAEAQGYQPGTEEYDVFVNKIVKKFNEGIDNPIISRTGWNEEDIVDYETRTLRFNASLHYRLTEKLDVSLRGTYGQGNSVYTAQNRFAFDNFHMTTIAAELKSPDFYIRAYNVSENSGDSYNAGGVALQMNEAWKPSEDWYGDYISSFTQTFLITGDEEQAHSFARLVAQNRTPQGTIFNDSTPSFPLPGSERFEQLLDSL
ncbi:MAG: TonB-dependent receptor, partial [Bacteroidetes bacterium]|nr:TonB-dependent receptor [Bacteroidota bacterium]